MQTSIIPLSLALENGRFDAEFYRTIKKTDASLKWMLISDILDSMQYGISIIMNEEGRGYPIFRMNEINEVGFLCAQNVNKCAHISSKEATPFFLKDRDVLFNRTNSFNFVGRTGIYYNKQNSNPIFASYLVKLVPNTNYVLPEVLATFLNTEYAIFEIKKRARISINQSNVSASELAKIKIPLFSPAFQKSIESMVLEAHAQRETANRLSAEAQELLEKKLGLFNWQPPKPRINVSVRPYSQTLQAKRIDAEYYQQRYEAIINKLKAYKGGVRALGEVSAIQKGIEPGSAYYKDEGIPFVRIANLSSQGLTLENSVKLDASFYKANKGLQPQKNEVLLSKDGTAGIAYCLFDEPEPMLTSGGILRLKVDPNIMLPEVLALVLNSRSIQAQVEQCAGGAIILHWRMEEIQNTLIPLICQETQNEIAQKVQQAHAARQKAKGLLQQAKEAVERAIEKGE